MATGSNDAEKTSWKDDDLQLVAAVLYTIFESIMINRPHPRVKSIELHEGTHKAGSEHTYKTFIRTYKSSPEKTCDDPTPPGQAHFRTQLVMTDKCDLFCALMEGIVREVGHALFGVGFDVHWVQCWAKPKSVLVTESLVGKLKKHSVLRITLPSGQIYIFDGSSAQYDWDFYLVRQDVYEAEYAQSAADANWKTGSANPFVVMNEEEKERRKRAHPQYEYWIGFLGHLENFVGKLKWSDYRGRPMDELKTVIFAEAKEAFGED